MPREYKSPDSLAIYARDLAEFQRVSEEEEQCLRERIAQGDRQAERRLIEGHLWIGRTLASQYADKFGRSCLPDLLGEANVALTRYAAKFNPEQPYSFGLGAHYRIRAAMHHLLARSLSPVRLPIALRELRRDVTLAAHDLRQELQREPTRADIAERLGVPLRDVEQAAGVRSCPVDPEAGSEPEDGAERLVDYRWRGSRRRYPVSETKKTANEIASRIEVQIADGTFKGPHTEQARREHEAWGFGRLCDEWYAVRKPKIRPATQEYYLGILAVLRSHFGEDTLAAAVSPLECKKFLAAKRAESKSPVRANRYLTVLRSLFEFALEIEIIDRNPTSKFKKEREAQREIFLTGEQVDSLLQACEPWLRPIVLTAYYTGARKGDLVGDNRPTRKKPALTWADVDLARRTITFRHTKERKTRTRRIGRDLLPVLFSLPSKPKDGESPEAKPVFIDDKKRPVTADRAYRRLRAAARKAGIQAADQLRFHDLKHSCVSNLVAQGYSLEMIQAYVGHSTPYMTQRYAHIANERLDAMADGLSGTIRAQEAQGEGGGAC